MTAVGVHDDQQLTFEVEDRQTQEKKVVDPVVPFHQEWEPSEGDRRHRLAAWLTHPENRRFERAIVNRIWGLVFGRPWVDPVDDLPDPPGEQVASATPEWKHAKATAHSGPDLLDVLGADFREHQPGSNWDGVTTYKTK